MDVYILYHLSNSPKAIRINIYYVINNCIYSSDQELINQCLHLTTAMLGYNPAQTMAFINAMLSEFLLEFA